MQTAVQISIHALRVEGDHLPLSFLHTVLYFYPRPPGGGRPKSITVVTAALLFLSTPSGWRATFSYGLTPVSFRISIHALRVEGDLSVICYLYNTIGISIHALRVEGDYSPPYTSRIEPDISIHALRVEGDRRSRYFPRLCSYFYPRPPGGGRPRKIACSGARLLFLSTPSGWRATFPSSLRSALQTPFLSTPSGWRATARLDARRVLGRHFYPRPPGGGRQGFPLDPENQVNISIHALRVEGDSRIRRATPPACPISIHALRVEGDCACMRQ